MKQTRILPLCIGIAIVILSITASIYWLITRTPGDTADQVVDTVDKVATVVIDQARDGKNLAKEIAGDVKNGLQINPRVTVGSTLFTEGSRDISEHAYQEKTFYFSYTEETTYMMSKKKITLTGKFVGKAGYSLKDLPTDAANPFELNISEDGKTVTATLPAPEILSVEMIKSEFVTDDGGLWNQITKEDRERAMNNLQAGARKKLSNTDILEKTDKAFMDQVQDAIRAHAPEDVTIHRMPLS